MRDYYRYLDNTKHHYSWHSVLRDELHKKPDEVAVALSVAANYLLLIYIAVSSAL